MRKPMIIAAVLAFAMPSLPLSQAFATDRDFKVDIDDSGAVEVTAPDNWQTGGLSSLQLTLSVNPDDDESQVAFRFSEGLKPRIREYRYDRDGHSLTLYLAGKEALFDDIRELGVGNVEVTRDGKPANASVAVSKDSLRFANGTKSMTAPITEASAILAGDEGEGGTASDGEAQAKRTGQLKGSLSGLLNSFEGRYASDKDQYSPESYQALLDSADTARMVADDPDSTIESLEAALSDLQEKEGALAEAVDETGDSAEPEAGARADGETQYADAETLNGTTFAIAAAALLSCAAAAIALIAAMRRSKGKMGL